VYLNKDSFASVSDEDILHATLGLVLILDLQHNIIPDDHRACRIEGGMDIAPFSPCDSAGKSFHE